MKKQLILLLAVSMVLCGCGKQGTEDEAKAVTDTTAVQTETSVRNTAETTEATTTLETVTSALAETTAEAVQDNGDAPSGESAWLDSSVYFCALEIPAGWEATSGVSDGNISEAVSIFQPITPNGDSISLAIQDVAEDPAVFSAMTAEDLQTAYSGTFDTAEISTFESVTLDGCPGYLLVVGGEASGVSMEMTQLIVNRTDTGQGEFLYMLTYTNASGEDSDYAKELLSHFGLTE